MSRQTSRNPGGGPADTLRPGGPDRDERARRGKAARRAVPLDGQAELLITGRPDPIALLERQNLARVPELVPIRYGRMSDSPFAFLRGAALPMVEDLARLPSTGLISQLCGDAHLGNFGLFASPERHLVFDLNDFDETVPGPFEWDVKRLAASIAVITRGSGFGVKQRRRAVLAAVGGYRETIRRFAAEGNLFAWYTQLDVDAHQADLLRVSGSRVSGSRVSGRGGVKSAAASHRDSSRAYSKLLTVVDGVPRIIADPPVVVPIEDLLPDVEESLVYRRIEGLLRSYRRTLSSDRQHLLDQYRLVHLARKASGVGSVGTRVWILLLEGIDQRDALFLQAKEAGVSVLAAHTGAGRYGNQGQRVVAGQRLMQATGDAFLGWQRATGVDDAARDYYLRRLHDWKGSVAAESMTPTAMTEYATICGGVLARAHARSGDRISIAAYLGSKDRFDQAVADFAEAYADVTAADHAALQAAGDSGRIPMVKGV